MSHPDSKYMTKYLKPLVGCTVKDVKPSSDDEWTTIVFEGKDGISFECELSADAEGNAPGFMFGLPAPKD